MSWNGGGFDLPVLNHRALIHGVTAAKFWDWGDEDREFKFNSYLGRYHTRHLDLMDVLRCTSRARRAGLDAMARLCGFPGKLGMDGSEVHAAFAAGKLDDVRRYCETDVMNTYLALPALPADARRAVGGRVREGNLARAREDRGVDAPHWRGIHRGLGRQRRR